MKKALLTAMLISTATLVVSTPALAAKKGTACTTVSSKLDNIYEVKFLCPEISQNRLKISDLYNMGYRVASLAFQGNIAALIVEQQ